jgi:hypothetical protein
MMEWSVSAYMTNELKGLSLIAWTGETETFKGADNERLLWIEVLLQAIKDLNGSDYRLTSKDIYEVRQWFISNVYEIGSFAWVCSYLLLDPTMTRNHILTHHHEIKVGRLKFY